MAREGGRLPTLCDAAPEPRERPEAIAMKRTEPALGANLDLAAIGFLPIDAEVACSITLDQAGTGGAAETSSGGSAGTRRCPRSRTHP